MSAKLLTKLAIRLLSLYFFITHLFYGVGVLIYLVQNANQSDVYGTGFSGMNALPSIFLLLACVLLWSFADQIATLALGSREDKLLQTTVSYEELSSIVLAVVGILLLTFASSEFAGAAYQLIQLNKWAWMENDGTYTLYVQTIVSELVKAIIGMVLLNTARKRRDWLIRKE